jgi:hypothetical protein
MDVDRGLGRLTKEANEKSFINGPQHGGYDVTWNRRIVDSYKINELKAVTNGSYFF